MENTKKLKIYIGISYIILISTFLYYFFSKFSFQEVSSYEFIKNNVDYVINCTEKTIKNPKNSESFEFNIRNLKKLI